MFWFICRMHILIQMENISCYTLIETKFREKPRDVTHSRSSMNLNRCWCNEITMKWNSLFHRPTYHSPESHFISMIVASVWVHNSMSLSCLNPQQPLRCHFRFSAIITWSSWIRIHLSNWKVNCICLVCISMDGNLIGKSVSHGYAPV